MQYSSLSDGFLIVNYFYNGHFLYLESGKNLEDWSDESFNNSFRTLLAEEIQKSAEKSGRSTKGGLIPDIDLDLKMPRGLSYILGEGGHIKVAGFEEIDIEDDAAGNGIPVPEGENGVWGWVFTFGDPIPADTVIYDYIEFHCECANGPTTITLWCLDVKNLVPDFIWDTVVIHQIPEPATVLLLGFGGILLRRKIRNQK